MALPVAGSSSHGEHGCGEWPGNCNPSETPRARGRMADRDGIGGRVAALRKTRGWTARELARRARVSYSLLAKVETGSVPASPAFTGAVARALRVDVSRVTGQPYEEPGNARALQATVEPLRRALLVYDLPPLGDVRPRPAGELRTDVVAVSVLGREARSS